MEKHTLNTYRREYLFSKDDKRARYRYIAEAWKGHAGIISRPFRTLKAAVAWLKEQNLAKSVVYQHYRMKWDNQWYFTGTYWTV